jgi:hypothetical protein
LHANAGKHKAASYKRAGEMTEGLKEEVKELMRAAEGERSETGDTDTRGNKAAGRPEKGAGRSGGRDGKGV